MPLTPNPRERPRPCGLRQGVGGTSASAAIPSPTMATLAPCAHCGNPLGPGAGRCPKCGALTEGRKDRRRSIAVVVVLVLVIAGPILYVVLDRRADQREIERDADRYGECVRSALATGRSLDTCDYLR